MAAVVDFKGVQVFGHNDINNIFNLSHAIVEVAGSITSVFFVVVFLLLLLVILDRHASK